MSEQEISRHLDTIREFTQSGGPLSPDSPYATSRNGQWMSKAGLPNLARVETHARLLGEYRDGFRESKTDRKAIILAGPPGAGKSTTVGKLFDDTSTGIGAQQDYLPVDSDAFKALLLQEQAKSGTLETHLKSPEIKDREAAGERFFLGEFAALVHEESSVLARALLTEVIAEGRNIIFDSVFKSEEGAREVMAQLNEAGYSVQIVDVEVSLEISQERIMSRWRHGYERGLDSGDPHHFGGRWVPMEYAAEVQNGPEGVSKPQYVAEKMANEFPNVTAFRRWRTTQMEVPGSSKAVGSWEVNQARTERGGALTDTTRVTAPEAAYRPQTRGRVERGGIER